MLITNQIAQIIVCILLALESDHNHERRHECVKQRGVGNKAFVLYLRNSVLKKIPYISLIRDPLTKTLTIQREKTAAPWLYTENWKL